MIRRHLWARQYDRELSSLLGLQGEIAQEIGDEILLTLGEDKSALAISKPQTPKSYEAYDLYLKGRYFWNKRTPESFEEAIKYFQQAIAKDPDYARAYAGLADCYALLPGYTMTVPQTEALPKARAAALKALQLDGELAEAHTSLALITENYDWDWQTAEKEYRRAIDLNPNYATAHHWYAEYLTWNGRFDEAFQESERARQLDPLSLIIAADNAMIFYYSRQYDRAEKGFNAVLEMEPTFPRAHMVRSVYVETGQFEKALADIDKYNPDNTPWERVYVLGRAGRPAEAQHAMEGLRQLEPSLSRGSSRICMGIPRHGKKGRDSRLSRKSLCPAFQYDGHAQGRARMGSAAERPEISDLGPARWTGAVVFRCLRATLICASHLSPSNPLGPRAMNAAEPRSPGRWRSQSPAQDRSWDTRPRLLTEYLFGQAGRFPQQEGR